MLPVFAIVNMILIVSTTPVLLYIKNILWSAMEEREMLKNELLETIGRKK